jgi:thiamine pyrophosphate-dependent acetolactate synthase large subunit-like protein
MKVAEAIARAVALEAGATPVFALIGDANLPMIGALDRFTDVPLRFARHEGAAVAMADGYAQITGGLGLASVTSGPGLTHAATSLLASSRMRTPLVVLTGDTPMTRPAGLQAMQDFDQRRFADACEIGFQDLRSPASLADDVLSAFHQARARRQPVLLNAPLDVQAAPLPDGWRYEPSRPTVAPREPSEAAVRRILDIAAAAQRPLVLAGRGALRAGAAADLRRFAESIGALLGTTLLAKGLFDRDPWSLGVVGGFTGPAALDVIRDCDAVFAFGAELGHVTSQAGSLMRGRAVVRVDLEPFPPGFPQALAFAVQAGAAETAAALVGALGSTASRSGFRTAATRARLDAAPPETPPTDAATKLDPRAVMRALGPVLPRDTRVVVGGGHFWSFPCMYLAVPADGAFLCPLGAAAVGQALPFAIGVAAGAPGKPVVAVEGDGSLFMNIQEMETAARAKLPLAVVVMNDAALTAEVIKLRAEGYNGDLATYPTPDFAAMARGFGWQAATLGGGDDIARVFRDHRWGDGPLLVDARISREITISPVALKDLGVRA